MLDGQYLLFEWLQEKEIAAAAEKLAECQETILLLGRQLQTLRPPSESLSSALNRQLVGKFPEDQVGPAQGTHSKKASGQFDADYTFSNAPGTGNVSPLNGYNTHKSPTNVGSPYFASPSSSKRPKHRSRSSSSSFSNEPEKQGRGFSRLFSKGKSDR